MKLPTFKLPTTIKIALPVALVAAGVTLSAYVAAQQVYRQTANDPQIQLAEDAAASLARGSSPDSVLTTTKVDVAHSLAPFMVVFDADRSVLAANADLDGRVPVPPTGAFAAAQAGAGKGTTQPHENRFTWEPQSGVRIATVLVYHGGAQPGYVLAARSLREVEIREDQLYTRFILTLVGILLVLAAFALLVR